VIRRDETSEEESAWRDQLAACVSNATGWTGNEARILEYGVRELSDASVRPLIEEVLIDGIALGGSRHDLRVLIEQGDA